MSSRLFVRSAVAAVLGLAFALPATAHFQEILPSADVLSEGGEVRLDLVFTHPFEGGPVMDMKRPAAVGVLAHGAKTDLGGQLVEHTVGQASTWSLSHELEEPGAAVFYVTPQPYFEPSENLYIVHHAKVVVDNYASGEGWDAMVGLPVEIQPLTRPTGLWAGNLFTGVVTKGGEPVPFADVEVAYVNHDGVKAPNESFAVQHIKADANGTFSYAMPAAGWWGFAALLEGDKPMTAPDGSQVPVEEGALIWVNASAMER